MWGKLRHEGTEYSLQNLKTPGNGSYLQGKNTNEIALFLKQWNEEQSAMEEKVWSGTN